MCTILIVEDNDDHRELTRFLLTNAGHTVIEAKNGQEALDWLSSHPSPCAVLLDLTMPVVDGWDFLNILRRYKRWCDLPVIVLSVGVKEHEPAPVMAAEAYWSKPLTTERIERIHEWCPIHRRTPPPLLKQSGTRLVERPQDQPRTRASGARRRRS